MAVKYALLGILKEEPRHGYELKTLFDEKVGEFWSLNYGQIYTTLDRLEKDGLVSYTEEAQDSRPDKKVYYISPKGVQELGRWLQEPIKKTRALRDELFVKLLFLEQENHEALLELIRQQTNLYMQKMTELTQHKYEMAKKKDDSYFITDLLIDAGLFHAEADVRWLKHCEAKLLARYQQRENQL